MQSGMSCLAKGRGSAQSSRRIRRIMELTQVLDCVLLANEGVLRLQERCKYRASEGCVHVYEGRERCKQPLDWANAPIEPIWAKIVKHFPAYTTRKMETYEVPPPTSLTKILTSDAFIFPFESPKAVMSIAANVWRAPSETRSTSCDEIFAASLVILLSRATALSCATLKSPVNASICAHHSHNERPG